MSAPDGEAQHMGQARRIRHERCDDPSKPTCLRPRPDQNVLPMKAVRAEPREEVVLLRTETKPDAKGGPDEVWANIRCGKGEGWMKTNHLKDPLGVLSQVPSGPVPSTALGPAKPAATSPSPVTAAPMDNLNRTLPHGMPSGNPANTGLSVPPYGPQTSGAAGAPTGYTSSSLPVGMVGPAAAAAAATAGVTAAAAPGAALTPTNMPLAGAMRTTPPAPPPSGQAAPGPTSSAGTQWVWPTQPQPQQQLMPAAQQQAPAVNTGEAPLQSGPLSPAARMFPSRAQSEDFSDTRNVMKTIGGAQAASANPAAARSNPIGQVPMAADSEDMENRSTAGSMQVARDAFGRELEEVASRIQAVSLGSSCGVKLSLRRLGLGEATMPFDWMRTRCRGLVQWIRKDFDGFFSTNQRLEVIMQETLMTVYRSPVHSFWHDDIQETSCHEKLQRRIDRFFDLGAKQASESRRPLLFVRSVAGSEEIYEAEELFRALCDRFEVHGRKVHLLLIVEDQPMLGPILHSKYEGLVFWVQPMFEGRLSTSVQFPAPYEDAIAFMIRRMLGERGGLYIGEPEETWPMVSQASEIVQAGSTFRNAGFKDTEVGLWVGHLKVTGYSPDEVLFSAFEGLDSVDLSQKKGHLGAPLPLQAQPVSRADSAILRGDSSSRAASFAGRETTNRAKVLMLGALPAGAPRAFATQPNLVVSAY